jgi:O-antigen/teichoic acid export membrane protein
MLSLFLGAAALGAASSVLQSVGIARLERELHYARIGRIEVLEPLVFMAVAVTAAWRGRPAEGIALGLLLRGWVPALAAWRAAGLAWPRRPPSGEVIALLRVLAPFAAAQSVLWVILAAPPVVVGRVAGPAALGHAQLAYSLLGSAGIPAAVFQRLAFAVLSRRQHDAAGIATTVRWALRLLGGLYVPAVFLVTSLAPVWVPKLLGEEWRAMAWVLCMGALPVTCTGLFGIHYAAALARGRHRLVLVQNAIHAAIYWAALALLVRRWGALAVPAAHLIATGAGLLYVREYRRAYGPVPAASAFWSIPVYGVVAALVAAACARGALVWGLGLWALVLGATAIWIWPRLELHGLWRRIAAGDAS